MFAPTSVAAASAAAAARRAAVVASPTRWSGPSVASAAASSATPDRQGHDVRRDLDDRLRRGRFAAEPGMRISPPGLEIARVRRDVVVREHEGAPAKAVQLLGRLPVGRLPVGRPARDLPPRGRRRATPLIAADDPAAGPGPAAARTSPSVATVRSPSGRVIATRRSLPTTVSAFVGHCPRKRSHAAEPALRTDPRSCRRPGRRCGGRRGSCPGRASCACRRRSGR